MLSCLSPSVYGPCMLVQAHTILIVPLIIENPATTPPWECTCEGSKPHKSFVTRPCTCPSHDGGNGPDVSLIWKYPGLIPLASISGVGFHTTIQPYMWPGPAYLSLRRDTRADST